jgi:hypothetical protein
LKEQRAVGKAEERGGGGPVAIKMKPFARRSVYIRAGRKEAETGDRELGRRGARAEGRGRRRRNPMEFLWNSYGVPMEFLWKSYGTIP